MTPTVTVSDALRTSPERVSNEMPQFTYAVLGRVVLDDLASDLVVVPKLYNLAIPTKLHCKDARVGDALRKKVKAGFRGKRGSLDVLSTELPNSKGTPGAKILLTGIGAPESYCVDVAEEIFEVIFKKALELGVEKLTVPFVAKRVTSSSLGLRRTACRMKKVLAKVLAAYDKPAKLKEVQVFCTSAARRHIQDGLNASPEDACACAKRSCAEGQKKA